MDFPKVIITDNYTDFLDGREVEATVISNSVALEKGMHVMSFHDSIAVNSDVSVPRDKQSQYIGIEGIVTGIDNDVAETGGQRHVKVIKF